MKTAELTGAVLDYWVAKAEGRLCDTIKVEPVGTNFLIVVDPEQSGWVMWSPSRIWTDGGQIIEREKITLVWTPLSNCWSAYWCAETTEQAIERKQDGSTPLIAAMRCYVCSVFGPEVNDDAPT